MSYVFVFSLRYLFFSVWGILRQVWIVVSIGWVWVNECHLWLSTLELGMASILTILPASHNLCKVSVFRGQPVGLPLAYSHLKPQPQLTTDGGRLYWDCALLNTKKYTERCQQKSVCISVYILIVWSSRNPPRLLLSP